MTTERSIKTTRVADKNLYTIYKDYFHAKGKDYHHRQFDDDHQSIDNHDNTGGGDLCDTEGGVFAEVEDLMDDPELDSDKKAEQTTTTTEPVKIGTGVIQGSTCFFLWWIFDFMARFHEELCEQHHYWYEKELHAPQSLLVPGW